MRKYPAPTKATAWRHVCSKFACRFFGEVQRTETLMQRPLGSFATAQEDKQRWGVTPVRSKVKNQDRAMSISLHLVLTAFEAIYRNLKGYFDKYQP